MNPFMKASIAAVKRNGRPIVYTSIETVVDKITGSVVQVKTPRTLIMYPKSVKVNQFNFPDLIGKDVVIFYLVNYNLDFTPKVNDTISLNGKTFTVRSYDFHEAHGENCLYRITGAA